MSSFETRLARLESIVRPAVRPEDQHRLVVCDGLPGSVRAIRANGVDYRREAGEGFEAFRDRVIDAEAGTDEFALIVLEAA